MADRLTWYFAYGSNMDAGRLATRNVEFAERIAGRLDGWQLTFDKIAREPAGAGAGNIVLRPGAVVHGTLNSLRDEGFAILDRFEGVAGGHYERRSCRWYAPTPEPPLRRSPTWRSRSGPGLRPTRAYLCFLLAGRDLLPADYFESLKATPTFD